MDKIYSRNRIRLPMIIYQNFNIHSKSKKNKRKIKFITILMIAIVTFTMAINGITPVFETLCKDKAKEIATIMCNEESTKIIKNYKYEDIVTIYKDTEGNITMIKLNITPINLIISDVAEKIQKRLNQVKQEEIGLQLGSFTGTRLLSGIGPTIPVKLSTTGNVDTDLRSKFESTGINQTIHRIYLQIDCKINILTPYAVFEENISNQILIAENIIVGKIPQSYYNLEGMNQSNAVDIIE